MSDCALQINLSGRLVYSSALADSINVNGLVDAISLATLIILENLIGQTNLATLVGLKAFANFIQKIKKIKTTRLPKLSIPIKDSRLIRPIW